MQKIKLSLLSTAVISLLACGPTEPKDSETESKKEKVVNVYSHRYYDTDKMLFEKFTEQTGIIVNVKEDGADKLIALLQSEGENTSADLLITVDAGRLYYAKELDLLQPVESDLLKRRIPDYLRDNENKWFSLTKRARVILYNKDNVDVASLGSYEDLASESWNKEIFVRSSGSVYNQSLFAAYIAHHGEEEALIWAKSIVSNMAREPKGNDRDQIKEVAAGNGKIAIANSYYLGKLLNSENEMEKNAGVNVGIYFPKFKNGGTHINVSGAGITKYAPNRDNAQALLEFLTSAEAQKVFAESNFEYPVNREVEASDLLKSWGEFEEDSINLGQLGLLNEKAVELFEAAGWN